MKILYTERFVAFLDVLGFSELIRRSALDPPEISLDDIISALDIPGPAKEGMLIIGTVGDISKSDHRIKQFSDCIVISTEPTEAGLLYLVHHIEKIGFSLLKLGFLCRGGITKGQIFHDKNVVLGPAMIKTYKLEKETAKFPRVILSKEVEDIALAMDSGQGIVLRSSLFKCEDFYIVHILRLLSFVLSLSGEVGEWERIYLKIKANLINEINRLKDCPKEKEYVTWFKSYFEQTVNLSGLRSIKLIKSLVKQ